MRLANRSYTQVKVKISEGLGGGSRISLSRFLIGVFFSFLESPFSLAFQRYKARLISTSKSIFLLF